MAITGWTIIALTLVVFFNTLFIAGLAIFVGMMSRKMDEALRQAEPLITRASETLEKVDATTAQLQERVDQVLQRTTHLVDRVTERVDTTTAIAEEAITEPLIGAASVMAGLQRGFRVYADHAQEKGDGKS